MPKREELNECIHCNYSSAKKNGFYKGRQKYKCTNAWCARSYSLGSKTYGFNFKEEVRKKYKDGQSLNSIAIELSLSWETVKRWVSV